LWEFATEQEVTHGSYEVFPFTLGTQKILIKIEEEMLYFWLYTNQSYDRLLLRDIAVTMETF